MYNIVMNTPELLVVDDFLPQEDWDRIYNQVQLEMSGPRHKQMIDTGT
jgi:hypothetical protein